MKKRMGLPLCVIVGVIILVVLVEQFRAWQDCQSALDFLGGKSHRGHGAQLPNQPVQGADRDGDPKSPG